jgi:outer membrane protein assembly factor BamB
MKPFCRSSILLAITLFLLTSHVALAQDKNSWPKFRGPDGMGVSSAKGLPVTWSADENVLWKTPMPGPGTSSPVIHGNRLYLTYYTGFMVPGQQGDMDDLRLHLIAVDHTNGKILWDKTIMPALPEQDTIREGHGYASSTPVVDDERIYVFFGKSGVFAFDHQGNQLWNTKVGSNLHGWGSGASPILYEDLVIVNASVESQSLVALDKRTGKEKWRAGGIREAWNTPVVVTNPDGKPELIVPIMQKILAFNPNTGDQLWSCNTEINWYMVPSIVAKDGIIYCIGGRSGGALAVRTGGSGDVTNSHRIWTGRKGSNVSSPILHNGHLYWMHEGLGIAYCAEAKSGNIIYEERIPRADQIYACPILAEGKIYYLSRSGRCFVVAAEPEFKLLATNEVENRGHFDASPAAVDGKLFLRSNRYLYCLGKKE